MKIGRGTWVVGGLAAWLSCATNPATGKRELSLVSEKEEVSIGRQAAEEVRQTIGLYPDAKAQAYVAGIGKKLAAASERPDLAWTFEVVDDAAVNAFALPGGHIFVTRGILAHLNSEAELASVLGHEIGHVTGKHSVKMLSRAKLAEAGLGIASVLSERAAQLSQIGAAGLQVLFLKYSRSAEYEADELGIRYASRGDYDLRAMPRVFATLKAAGGGSGGRLPGWLSTHPEPEDRIERANGLIAKLPSKAVEGELDRASLVRVTDGMVFGEDPRKGYFDGATFKHPELRFSLRLPDGWKTANLPQAVIAQSPSGDAAVQLTLVPSASPDAALRQFASQGQGKVRLSEPRSPVVPNLPSAGANFRADLEGQPVTGQVTFVSHGGRTFQILAITPVERYDAYDDAFGAVATAFAPLTDPASLSVQPARIKVVSAPRAMTVAELAAEAAPGAKVETIALINQMAPTQSLTPGQLVKVVQGGPPGRPGIAAR